MKSIQKPTAQPKSLRVFVTGATGFVGAGIVKELLRAGHRVLGLARSESSARSLRLSGAEVHHGDINDLEAISAGASLADGVIHTAFDHDFSKFAANCERDRSVVTALGTALAGTGKPLVITSAIGVVQAAPQLPATEADPAAPVNVSSRSATEEAALALTSMGVNVSIVRLPQVHDQAKQGLVTELIKLAREKRLSAFVGSGANRWSAAHIDDVARLYRLALEKNEPLAVYHPVAEEGVALRDIALVIGAQLNVPVVSLAPDQAKAHFGWLNHFAIRDMSASSTTTQRLLGWHPTGADLLTDLNQLQG